MSREELATGVIVPMITPFDKDGKIDVPAAGRLTQHVIAGRSMPFVLGTTGESASIPRKERYLLVESVVRAAGGKVPVYAGISATSMADSRQFARDYFTLGIDAVVAHLPAYYHLPDESIYRYFYALADDLDGPLILYNITAVTHQSLPLEIIDRLSRHPNIIAVKDSERDRDRFDRSIELWGRRPDFKFLAGWGAVMADALMQGAAGIVPSTGNIVPGLYADLYAAATAGDRKKAGDLHNRTMAISEIYQKGLSLGESLAALKVILNGLGICGREMLPPLYRLDPRLEEKIAQKYQQYGAKG